MTLNLDKTTWKSVAFGDVIENVANRVDNPGMAGVDRYVGLEHLDPFVMTVQRWGTPDEVNAQKLLFEPGDVIFGRRRAYQKKVARADFRGICSAHALVLRARPDFIHPDFLPVFLSSDYFLNRAISISVGSLSPTVNWRDLKVQEFNLPPLDEQRRVADLLWAVERHRQSLQATDVRVREMHTRVRVALLTHGLHKDWMTTGISTDAVDHWTDSVPEGWSAVTIAEVGRVRSGATPNRSEQARYFDGGTIPWVKTLDLNESVLIATDENITPIAVSESSAKVVPANTVLVAMYGGFGQIGRTARLGVDAATNQAVSAVLNLRADVLPEFLHQILMAGRPKWRKVAASSRKDPNITKRDIEKFNFPLPPINEQQAIVDLLSKIQVTLGHRSAEHAVLRGLRDSVLSEMFGAAE